MSGRPKVVNSIIRLDYSVLKDTTYEGCTLVYEGGRPPTMTGCDFVKCEFVLEGPARNTQEYLSSLARGLDAKLVVVDMLGISGWEPKVG